MKALGKRFSLKRKIMQLKGTTSKSLEEAVKVTIKQVADLAESGIDIKQKMPSNDPTKTKMGNTINVVKSFMADKDGTVKDIGNIAKSSDIIRRAYGNQDVKNAVNDIRGVSKETNKAARKQVISDHIDDFKRKMKEKRKFRTQDQDLLDSLVGANDENSTYQRKFVKHD